MNRLIFLFLSTLFFNFSGSSQEVSLSVFNNGEGQENKWILYKNNDEALYKIITDKALGMLEKRQERIQQLQTREDWLNYQKKTQEVFGSSLKKFQKTPLNAKITGTIEKDNFTVEKIIFESHPEFYVTGCMFLPKNRQNPAPAVIYVSGHTELGFRSETYQRVILNLVQKGFIVFAIDPIGQGERLQYLNQETGKSKIGGSTTEHSYAGAQTLLTGTSLSDYFIWDGVRAIDYLETRAEVDANRIGITGRSGGGTQTALIAAFDKRIYAAAPECYITNFTRLLQSIGPQDAEQNPYQFLKNGLDHPDLIHMRAPKPTLIVTTTHDFFSQQGARETFAETQKSYTALGKASNIRFTEDFGGHESTKKNRETVYAFFQEHLRNPGDNTDNNVNTFEVEELWVTPTGQLGSSLKGKTVYDLNQEYFSGKELSQTELKQKVKEISGIEFSRKLTAAVFTGEVDAKSYKIQKYFLENNSKDFALPLFKIKSKNTDADKILIWLDSDGKEAIANSALLPKFLGLGYTIISADLPGTGELKDPEFRGDGFVQNVPFNYTFVANLVGTSVTGVQAEAIDLIAQYLVSENPGTTCDVFANGTVSEAVLHYSVLKNPFDKIILNESLQSYRDLIQIKYYNPKQAFSVAPGCLPYYDIDELISVSPGVKRTNILNAEGEIITNQKTDSQIISLF
ncbi:prolyl oligopeptidase family serine peptidase [Maribellus comscasis]|uniref:Prolyl oligopeptidase family serine peptidase n=1 Tax=Maribellus comscasis TaxID=2681766 RepID=A0A6I6K321_9BACT|nr:acetylxylan esterase [Maribellus comscasis]QGY45953.1 prolyl oligopeptidase family serine peptidase [Maribellus comscasis]